jgi:hypothetical protein
MVTSHDTLIVANPADFGNAASRGIEMGVPAAALRLSKTISCSFDGSPLKFNRPSATKPT